MRVDKTELRRRIRLESCDQTEITVRDEQKLSLFEVPLIMTCPWVVPRGGDDYSKTDTGREVALAVDEPVKK